MGVGWGGFVCLAVLVLAGVLTLVAVWWRGSRLQPLAAAQREAVALLQPSPEPKGRNAFAALWLLGRDVPEARLRQVADAGMRRIRAELARSSDALPAGPGKDAAAPYPALQPDASDTALSCSLRDLFLTVVARKRVASGRRVSVRENLGGRH